MAAVGEWAGGGKDQVLKDRRKAIAVIQVRGTVRAVDEADGFQRWLGVTIDQMRIHESLWVRKK